VGLVIASLFLDFFCLFVYFGEFTDSLAVRSTVTDSDGQVQRGWNKAPLGFLLIGFFTGLFVFS